MANGKTRLSLADPLDTNLQPEDKPTNLSRQDQNKLEKVVESNFAANGVWVFWLQIPPILGQNPTGAGGYKPFVHALWHIDRRRHLKGLPPLSVLIRKNRTPRVSDELASLLIELGYLKLDRNGKYTEDPEVVAKRLREAIWELYRSNNRKPDNE